MAETGLNYNWNRDYDPQTGKYIENDPIGLQGGTYATYVYVSNSPIGAVDIRGLAVVVGGFAQEVSPGKPTVVCDMGTMRPELPPLTPLMEKCVSDCMLVHENSHIDDLIQMGGAGVCRFREPGRIVTFDNDLQRFNSEKKAYAAEVACLKAKLASLNCGSDCQQVVSDRIRFITPFVTHPPGFPPNFH